MSAIALFFGGALLATAFVGGLLTVKPAVLANVLRFGFPAILAAFGVTMLLIGRGGLGIPLLVFALAMFSRARNAARATRRPGGRSQVRSAALEMELDLDSGDLNGLVLAGTFEGRELDHLNEGELEQLHEELSGDHESLGLFEAYLDRRKPGWRGNPDMDEDAGLGTAPSAGAMTEKEAYEVLGLAAGADESEIREAHRRLMKRMHPDAGGTAFLAGRINEAKDVLLRRHD